MELDIHNIIKGAHLSDKAHGINKKLNQLVLEVHNDATKPAIKHAVQTLFGVKVRQVRTHVKKSKPTKGINRRRRVTASALKKTKIAYVALAKGHELNLFGQAEAQMAAGVANNE